MVIFDSNHLFNELKVCLIVDTNTNMPFLKMKFIHLLILSLTIISCKTKISLNPDNDFKPSNSFNHIKHIRVESQKSPIYLKEMNKYRDRLEPKYFVDYVIQHVLKKPEHKKYITDRRLLKKLKNNTCYENYVLISDTLNNGDECEIEIKLKVFEKQKHKLDYDREGNFLIKVDGKYPYGAIYSECPETEIKSFQVKINEKELNADLKDFQNLYNPNFCNFGGHQRILEAYEDGDYLYIYIFGGGAASQYFAKLIFDKSGFITSIITEYVPLSIYGSFSEDFIGY